MVNPNPNPNPLIFAHPDARKLKGFNTFNTIHLIHVLSTHNSKVLIPWNQSGVEKLVQSNCISFTFSFFGSLLKERGDLERERDTLRMETNMLKNKMAIQENSMQDLKSSIEEKVRSTFCF